MRRPSFVACALLVVGCAPGSRTNARSRPAPTAPSAVGTSASPRAEPAEAAATGCAPLAARAPEKPADVLAAPVPSIERASELRPFLEALSALERGQRREPVRIGIWGDSNWTLDEVSGALRRALQRRFGDAGHGFIGVGNPFRGYRHMDVRRTMIGHWETYIFTRGDKPKRGGFGAAGMVSVTLERRARVRIETAESGAPVGTRAGRFGVFFAKQPQGGGFAIEVDGTERARIATAADAEGVGYEAVRVDDAPHRFEIVSTDQRRAVQIYGAVLERDEPGVIVDSFGVTGATFGTLAALAPESVRPMLEQRRHDLVVFALGTNFWNSEENPEGLRRLVELHRSIDPKRGLLVLTPPDHVKTVNHTQSDPRMLRVVEQLRAAAASRNIPLWDFREAMGGDGSMWVFHQRGLAGKDLYHLTSTGARMMGSRFAYALLAAHHAHVAEQPSSGCTR